MSKKPEQKTVPLPNGTYDFGNPKGIGVRLREAVTTPLLDTIEDEKLREKVKAKFEAPPAEPPPLPERPGQAPAKVLSEATAATRKRRKAKGAA